MMVCLYIYKLYRNIVLIKVDDYLMASTSKKSASSEPKVISKETIKRLLSDVKAILKSPLTENGIYYSHDDTDIMKGYAMIVGPEDTPYFGGFYFFKISYSSV